MIVVDGIMKCNGHLSVMLIFLGHTVFDITAFGVYGMNVN